MSKIENFKGFESCVNEKYIWPGGYGPYSFITKDGGILCFNCALGNMELIRSSIEEKNDPQWEVVESFINWEDKDIVCDNCNKYIDPEYEDD